MSNKFNWYPGHIAKAEKELKAKIKVVDIIVELRDARIPYASQHKDLTQWANGKPIITALNKSDLADTSNLKDASSSRATEWRGDPILLINSKHDKISQLLKAIQKCSTPIIEKYKSRGISNKPIKIMVVGYPNVGKSSLINKLAKGKKTRVEDKPGVTKRQQWVDVSVTQRTRTVSSREISQFKLLDTPGIIPPKLYSDDQALKLALCNCLGDKAYDHIEVARAGIALLEQLYPDLARQLHSSYGRLIVDFSGIDSPGDGPSYTQLEQLAARFLRDFREGKLGNLSLE